MRTLLITDGNMKHDGCYLCITFEQLYFTPFQPVLKIPAYTIECIHLLERKNTGNINYIDLLA